MFSSKCAVCDSKKSRFIKKVANSLGLRTPFSKIPLLGDILF